METNILIGLGNPGKNYEQTRHNVGFMFIDYLVSELSNNPVTASPIKATTAYQGYKFSELNLYTLKPQLFMNRSGEAVQEFINYYKLLDSHLIIAFDDLDLELGQYKIQRGKTPRDHNGINSVKQTLKTDSFTSVRIGIENRGELRAQIKGEDYVLDRFTGIEIALLQKVFAAIKEDLFKVL